MKKVLFTLLSLTLILAACNKDVAEDIEVERKAQTEVTESEETETKEESNEAETEVEEEPKEEALISFDELTTEELLAMTIIEQEVIDEIGEYAVPSSEEILKGEYSRPLFPGGEGNDVTNKIPEVSIINIDPSEVLLNNPDKPLTFYNINPPSMGGMAVFAVDDEDVLLFTSLGPVTYEEALANGHEYNIQELYDNNKNNEEVLKLVEKMNQYDNMEEFYNALETMDGE